MNSFYSSKNYTPIDKTRANSMLLTLSIVTIICCSFLKYLGYKDFEIPIKDIDINIWVRRIIYCALFITNGIFFSLLFIKRKLKKQELLFTILISLSDYLITYYMQSALYLLIDFLCYIAIGVFIKRKDFRFKDIIESLFIFFIVAILQFLSAFYKNVNFNFHIFENFIVSLVLQIDYYIMVILLVINAFRKGGYLYERHWWKTILVILSKRKSIKNSLEQTKNNVYQEVDIGFKVFVVLLSVAQFFLVGTLCYFINNAVFEYISIFISFVFMRYVFGKSYHSDKIIKCTTLAIITYLIATRVALPLWLSVLCNVLIGCIVAYIMYIWYYYITYTNMKYITLYKGMPIEEFEIYCQDKGFNTLEITRLKYKYVDMKTYKEIADIECVEQLSIKKFFQRINKKIKG